MPVATEGQPETTLTLYKPEVRLVGSHPLSLQWRYNGCDGVLNHQTHHCLLNRLFRRRSKKTSKLRVTGLCAGNHRWPVNSPHKGPVTRKMFPFDDIIMFPQLIVPYVRTLWPAFTDFKTSIHHRVSFKQRGWLYSALTHWDRDQINAISQTTFWSAFSWMKMFEFRLKFHWSLFLRFQLTIFQHWFR